MDASKESTGDIVIKLSATTVADSTSDVMDEASVKSNANEKRSNTDAIASQPEGKPPAKRIKIDPVRPPEEHFETGENPEMQLRTKLADTEARLCKVESENRELRNYIITLNFSGTNLVSVPSSIGQLCNLECLDLENTKSLASLPQEIGNLTSLKTLDLDGSSISSLPSTIGQLCNLETLYLNRTKNLASLPQEIGNLTSLTRLDLDESSVSSLPSSIGQLCNLKELHLRDTSISQLPDEVGNLSNLQLLNLRYSSITSLPHSMRKLKSLMVLLIYNSAMDYFRGPSYDSLFLMMAQQCPFLGYLDCDVVALESRDKIVRRTLAYNRARYRTSAKKSIQYSLWPLILSDAPRSFVKYDPKEYFSTWYIKEDKWGSYSIGNAEAIYHLLDDNRESFINVIMERNAKTNDSHH